MKSKNFRKVPIALKTKLKTIDNDHVQPGVILELSDAELKTLFGGNLTKKFDVYNYTPHAEKGRYSRRNTFGFKRIRKDLPKVSKTINLGERPIYGDYSKGTFVLTQERMVYQRDFVEPYGLKLEAKLIKSLENEGRTLNVVFVKTSTTIDKHDEKAFQKLFTHINILGESFGSANIFNPSLNVRDLIGNKYLGWEILPPGKGKKKIQSILSNSSVEHKHQFEKRFNVLKSLEPINYVYGFNGTYRYFGAMISENCVVFENLEYGNAIYIMFNEWPRLSKLTKAQIQAEDNSLYCRIEHRPGWVKELKSLIKPYR